MVVHWKKSVRNDISFIFLNPLVTYKSKFYCRGVWKKCAFFHSKPHRIPTVEKKIGCGGAWICLPIGISYQFFSPNAILWKIKESPGDFKSIQWYQKFLNSKLVLWIGAQRHILFHGLNRKNSNLGMILHCLTMSLVKNLIIFYKLLFLILIGYSWSHYYDFIKRK